jgi:beta-mannosidase
MNPSEHVKPRRWVGCDWKLARMKRRTESPGEWIPARVPGAVQLDWARAKGLPDFTFGQNVRQYDGLEDFYWLYETRVPEFTSSADARVFLVLRGVDHRCDVRVGDRKVASSEGISKVVEIEVTGAASGTAVQVLIYPAPKRKGCAPDRTQANNVTKAAVSYGWDWHPRLIPLGLSDECGFEVRPSSYIADVDFGYELSDSLDAASLSVKVTLGGPRCGHEWTLLDPAGACVARGTRSKGKLAGPRLWWTHDHGEQALYTLRVVLESGDTLVRRVGFRRVRLVMYEGAWEADQSMPKGRDVPPVTIELNGRKIFGKGSNWVNPDVFHGRVSADNYRALVALARGAHFNLLRCWGGAPASKDAFYEICDEMGILVWQEFPLACNLYPDDKDYLSELDLESRALIRRVRQHPCLGLWVGGNELFNAWSRMTDQSLPLRLLNSNCLELDPRTPFMPTSPIEGMGHGDYRFRNRGRDVFQTFQQARCTAYSEFGCPGSSPVAYLKKIIPEAELWPPKMGTSWETHHGVNAWEPDPTTWLCSAILAEYFGPAPDLETLVSQSTWLQGEGYRSVYEEARRQQPRCSMALSWCYNEAWPCAANNSIINWPSEPKPCYEKVRDACRPVLASARIPRFQWRAGEEFSAELWILNDTVEALPAGEVRATIVAGNERISLGGWKFGEVKSQSATPGPRLSLALPLQLKVKFILELEVIGHAEWSSHYCLSIRRDDLPPLPSPTP